MEINKVLLRNILYCYNYLDTFDEGKLEIDFIKEYISEIEYTDPNLYELLSNILEIITQCSSTIIAKDTFITHLYSILNDPNSSNSITTTLTLPDNPITHYFNRLEDNGRIIHEQDEDLSECTFTPKINKYKRCKNKNVRLTIKKSLQLLNQAKLYEKEVKDLHNFRGTKYDGQVTEYIIFHYNTTNDWEHTLRNTTHLF